MGFSKTCPICKEVFFSLTAYMSHIKNNHDDISPEKITKEYSELKWTWSKNI